MVFIHFPSNLTEEEQMLQSKYAKLRKKKKALQQLKTPKPEPEKIVVQKRHSKDAKEAAKKLLLSGAIKVENKEKQGFKRSKNFERKMSFDKPATSSVSGYQPFSQSHAGEEEATTSTSTTTTAAATTTTNTATESHPPNSSEQAPYRPPVKNLYESFVSARVVESHDRDRHGPEGEVRDRNRQGNTIYVHGYGVTEAILRNAFTAFGNIINISMETDKNCGFITFEKMESAERAINEMNGSLVTSILLKVSLARRQPVIETSGEHTSSNWSTIASSHSQKGCHKDKREIVHYEDDLF